MTIFSSKPKKAFAAENLSLPEKSKKSELADSKKDDRLGRTRKKANISLANSLTPEMKSLTCQLRLADEELDRVWTDKTLIEKDLRNEISEKQCEYDELQQKFDELVATAKVKEDALEKYELQLRPLLAYPDDSVLEIELEKQKTRYDELQEKFSDLSLHKERLNQSFGDVEKELLEAKTSILRQAKHVEDQFLEISSIRKDLEKTNSLMVENEKLKTELQEKKELLSQCKEESGRLGQENSRLGLLLKSHFQKIIPPDVEASRRELESDALLAVQKIEIDRQANQIMALKLQLQDMKCSTVDWLSAENERLKRKVVELGRSFSEEQEAMNEWSRQSLLFKSLEDERDDLRKSLQDQKISREEKEKFLADNIQALQAEISMKNEIIKKLKVYQETVEQMDVKSGLEALHSLSNAFGLISSKLEI